MSALAQTVDVRMEIIIGDDGSGKETPGIVKGLMRKYPGIIRYYRHEKNLGPSANYQFLVRRAQGQYIAHLDGDDLWLPGKLKAQIDWLVQNSDSAACYSNALVIRDNGEMYGLFGPVVRKSVDLHYLLAKGNFLNHSSMLYRAKYKDTVVDLAGAFIDYKMHLNFARIAPVGYINASLTIYRLGSEHSMIRNTPTLVQDLYFEAIDSVLSEHAVPSSVRRSALTHFWQSIALESMAKGRLKWSISWAKKIWRLYPHEFWKVLPVGFLGAIWRIIVIVWIRSIGHFLKANNLRVLHER